MRKVQLITLAASCLAPGLALAHAGAGDSGGFLHGLAHPVSGIDHLLAMLAVGLWAAQIGGRALWAVPGTFLGVMILGGMLGLSTLPVPLIEEGILVSVLILGVLVAGAFRLATGYSALLVGLFALFHGYAHGAEMPVTLGTGAYISGFAVATALLHGIGMGLGALMYKKNLINAVRFTGGAVALGGVYLAVA